VNVDLMGAIKELDVRLALHSAAEGADGGFYLTRQPHRRPQFQRFNTNF
jgi:hypothetical protein